MQHILPTEHNSGFFFFQLDRSETDIINVVEQRIWHSMEEGQFENLPGRGKPLELKTNPHADPAEDTLYRILMRNGCAPEWVELNKEIRCKINEWRSALKKAWAKKLDGHDTQWVEESEALKAHLRAINDKVTILTFSPILFMRRKKKKKRGSKHPIKLLYKMLSANCKSKLSHKFNFLQVLHYNLIVPFGRQMFGLKWEKELSQLER